MKLLMTVYSGTSPRRLSELLERHGGYTEFRGVHGHGSTGRLEGTRAWPGEATLFLSVLPDERADGLAAGLRELQGALPAGERLHTAVLPTETFF